MFGRRSGVLVSLLVWFLASRFALVLVLDSNLDLDDAILVACVHRLHVETSRYGRCRYV